MAALRAFLAALLLAASLWTLTVTPAEACTCRERTPEERVDGADLIVIGTTTDQGPSDPRPTPTPRTKPPSGRDPSFDPPGGIETKLTVEEYVKGSGPTEIVLVSGGTIRYGPDGEVQIDSGGGAACNFVPQVGVRYLLFLFLNNANRHGMSSCSGHAQITAGDEAALARVEEIRQLALAQGFTPSVGVSPDTGSDSDVILLFIAVGGAWVVLLSAGAFAIRRTSAKDEN